MAEAWFPDKLRFLFAAARYKVVRGGRGCIHPDSLIETPSGTVRVADFAGGEIYAFDGAAVVVAYAGKPAFYPAAQLYRVVFGDGSEIKTTAKHRFLSARGWVACSSLLYGDLIAAPPIESQPGQPPKQSDASQSELIANVRHCLQTLAGFQWCYFEDRHQCDERFLRGARTVLNVARQLSDEPLRSSHGVTHVGGLVDENMNIPSQLSRHLANLSDLLAKVARNFEALGVDSGDIASELLLLSSQASRLSHEKSALEPQAQRLAKLFLGLGSLMCQDESLQKAFGILRLDFDDSAYSSQVVCNPDRIITKKVCLVEPCEISVYCDIFVPFFNNYISAGVVHHNSGKSWGFARCLLIQGTQKPIRVLCTREVQKSIAQSVYQLLKDQIEALGLGHLYEVLATEIRGKNGTQFFFSGLSDQTAESLKSFEGVDVCWCEEAQAISARSWNILIPTIRKDGSEIWVSFNPQLESDETYRRFVASPPPGCVSIEMNHSDNRRFPSVLESERIHAQATMKADDYAHIWEGKCKPAVEGAIYFDQMAQAGSRIGGVPHDPLLKTHAVWDLGFNDSMSIILTQKVSSEIRVISYIEGNQRTLADYSAELRALTLDGQPINWGHHYLPHDGFAKRHQTGKQDAEILQGFGWSVQRTPNMDVEQGIKRARDCFSRIYFNKDRTQRLLECLKRYRRSISQATNEPGNPVHDEFSHGADAFRYLALTVDQMSNDEWGGTIAYPKLSYA